MTVTDDPWFEHDPNEELPGSPMGRTLLTVVGTIVAIALLAGAVLAVSLFVRGERTESAAVEVDPSVPVRLVTDGVDLRIVPTDGQQIEVDATVVEGLLGTDFTAAREGDDVVIEASCQEWLVPGCGAEVTVGVPRDLAVQVFAGDGDVALEDLTGLVTVKALQGEVQAEGLEVVELDVSTTSGDVDLSFAQQPSGIKARTDSGDIAVTVPEGDIGYNANVSSESGDVDDEVSPDEEPSGGFLTIETVSGDVSVTRP